MKRLVIFSVCAVMLGASGANAAKVTVTVNAITAVGTDAIIGTVAFQDTSKGLKIWPNLSSLAKGRHGFHIHENADCGTMEKDGELVVGLAAGGHFDPGKADAHEGPKGMGHLGDLPVLLADDDGRATRTSFAPRLKTADLLGGRTIVIHAGADNYSDQPVPLGGGGARVACGVVEYY